MSNAQHHSIRSQSLTERPCFMSSTNSLSQDLGSSFRNRHIYKKAAHARWQKSMANRRHRRALARATRAMRSGWLLTDRNVRPIETLRCSGSPTCGCVDDHRGWCASWPLSAQWPASASWAHCASEVSLRDPLATPGDRMPRRSHLDPLS